MSGYLRTSLRVPPSFLPEISRRRRVPSQQPRFGEAHIPTSPDDDVIVHRDVQQPASRHQLLSVWGKCEDTASWFSNRRMSEPAAMFKTVGENGTDRVLGAHLPRRDASDAINIFVLAVRHQITATDLKHMIYTYPTSTSDMSYMF